MVMLTSSVHAHIVGKPLQEILVPCNVPCDSYDKVKFGGDKIKMTRHQYKCNVNEWREVSRELIDLEKVHSNRIII